jgi:hypothetical protein
LAQPDEEQHVTTVAEHADGEWRVLFSRSLDSGGADDLVFPVGQAVPMAFQAWDGDNGESGNQGAVSTWYFLYLKQPTPLAVYVAPPVVLILTLFFGLAVIRHAQLEASGVDRVTTSRRGLPAGSSRVFGMGIGVVWLGLAFGAFQTAGAGWESGYSDLGFWWTVIAVFLAVAGVSALIGTWIHTQKPK